jgi:hypothetical protein
MGRLLPQGRGQPRPWQPQSGDPAHPAANERGGGALVPFFYQGGTCTQRRRPAAGMVVALGLHNGQWRGNCTHKLGKESSTTAPKKRGWKKRGLRGGVAGVTEAGRKPATMELLAEENLWPKKDPTSYKQRGRRGGAAPNARSACRQPSALVGGGQWQYDASVARRGG